MKKNILNNITYRSTTEEDRPYLIQLFGSTRDDVRKYGVHMTDEEQAAFIEMQFSLQDQHYKKFYPKTKFEIIQFRGKDAGRFYLNETDNDYNVVDITIDPSCRRNGIGHAIMSDLISQAGSKGKTVSIYVAKDNTAVQFYEKLGFAITGGTEVYHLMMWSKKDSGREVPTKNKETLQTINI